MTLRVLAPLFLLLSHCATTTLTESQARAMFAPQMAKPKAGSLLERLLGGHEAQTCPADGHLMITDAIDDDSSQAFVEQMQACHGRQVAIEIHSPGGSVFAALAMQKAIERHGKPVLCVVDGMAASAAAITLQSCTTRYATSRSIIMFHTAALTCQGHEQEMENCAMTLHALDEAMSEQVAKRLGMSAADFYAKISGGREWWLSANAAVQAHALDGEAADVSEVVRMVN